MQMKQMITTYLLELKMGNFIIIFLLTFYGHEFFYSTSYMHMRYNFGTGDISIAYNSTKVNDGLWHRVRALR